MLVFVKGGKPDNLEKNPRSKDENQQQAQPTYDAETGNRTRTTLAGGALTTAPSLLSLFKLVRLGPTLITKLETLANGNMKCFR